MDEVRCCSVEGCARPFSARGFCRGHYSRFRRTGDPGSAQIVTRRVNDSGCEVRDCPRMSKKGGLCTLHYQRKAKYGSATKTAHRDVSNLTVRHCGLCGVDISEKKSNAQYCSRVCKTAASERRRYQDGRAQVKDHARRDRIKAGGYAFLPGDWLKVLHRQRNACFYCGGGGGTLTMDHVVPLSKGGHHSVGNVVAACWPCNSSKRDMLLSEWLRRKGMVRRW